MAWKEDAFQTSVGSSTQAPLPSICPDPEDHQLSNVTQDNSGGSKLASSGMVSNMLALLVDETLLLLLSWDLHPRHRKPSCL